MALVNLKNIISKSQDIASMVQLVAAGESGNIRIEDDKGRFLFGNDSGRQQHQYAVKSGDEVIGWVNGGEKAGIIAKLLSLLSQKESEKKKLGNEVLNLYTEINLIYNFSEKLAQAIGAAAIAQITLQEASHIIRSQNGVVVLWDEGKSQLQTVASQGKLFFDEQKVAASISLLLKIVLSGQSDIISDLAPLKEVGIILPQVQSVMYAALKVKHRVMGAVILASDEPEQYAAADLKLLVTLGLQSSSAIESALLYERSIQEANEREEAMRRIYEVTGKFVPFEFIRSLGHELITDVKLGDQVEKIVTVLFSDIRDYTSLSEKMTPEANFGFICLFNETMGPIIRRHNGFINQYLGDAIMAIFPSNTGDALEAAIEMQQAISDFNGSRKPGHPAIQIGVGLHTGPLIMGITGDQNRMDAATISDTVNTASRIESLTKYYKSSIIISDACLQQLQHTERFHLRALGKVQVKGKQEAVSIHECFSGDSSSDKELKLASLPLFNEGIQHYMNRSFTKAFIDFQQVLETNPLDKTAGLFLGKTAKYISSGVSDNWVGVEEMPDK